MRTQNVPAAKQKQSFSIDNFLGVDFTSSPIDVDKRRSTNAKNIVNINGSNQKRHGYEVLNTIGSKINGVWNIDPDGVDMFLVHSGTKLYQANASFSEYTEVLSGMTDNRSMGLYIGEYLMIFDGTRVVAFTKNGNSYEANFLDTIGYIPTTSVSRDSAGGGQDYEHINLMSDYRINTFVPTAEQTDFILDDSDIDSIELVQKLGDDGEWDVVESTEYSFDNNNKVTFTTAPGESPLLERDSILIKYAKSVQENKDKINKCKIITLFGYEGNNDRIFATGNSDFSNYDFHSDSVDPTYWPDENITKIGIEPIVSYARLSDGMLAILKKQSDTDCTVYYRTSNMLNSAEVFPIKNGAKNIGCISSYATSSLLNDQLFLSSQGIFAIVSNENEKYAMQRSYYINGRLLEESNLSDACAISVDGKYYLGINNHVYIMDSKHLSYPKYGKTEQYQYECWYWENIPARVFFSIDNILYFGTSAGKICKFNSTYKDDQANIEVYWETPYIDLNSSQYAKTIKSIVAISNPKGLCNITIGYSIDGVSTDILTKNYTATDLTIKTIQENTRISKFMFIKFYFKNSTANKIAFERLIIEYILAGKYRGE